MCVYFLISLPPPSSNNCFALSTHTVRRPQTQDAQEAFFGFGASVIAAESTNRLVYVYSYLAHAIATKDLACPVRMQTSPRCSSASSTDCHMNGTVDAGLSTVHSMEFQSSFASAVSAK